MTSQWPHTYTFITPPCCRESYRLLAVHKHPRQCMMLRTHTYILLLTLQLIGRVPQAKKSRGKTDTALYIGTFPTMFSPSHHGYGWQASTCLPLGLCIGPFPTELFRLTAHRHIKSTANSPLPWLWTSPLACHSVFVEPRVAGSSSRTELQRECWLLGENAMRVFVTDSCL